MEPLNGQVAPDASPSKQAMINGIAPITIKNSPEVRGKTEIWRRNSDKSPTHSMIKSGNDKDEASETKNEQPELIKVSPPFHLQFL